MELSNLNLGVIYLITGPEQEHKYVGQTKMFRINHTTNKFKYFNYIGRFKEHITSAKYKPSYHVDRVIQKYGSKKFSVRLVKYCSVEELDDYEIKYILQFNTLFPNGLNIVLGNPHKASNKKHTSQLLKDHYSDINIKLQHSIKHRSKFKDFDGTEIIKIIIKAIKENGENKIVYMYIEYDDNSKQRRRYGGKHETWIEAYTRCVNDAYNLTNNVVDLTKQQPQEDLGEITSIELKIHMMKDIKLISLYIKNTDMKNGMKKKDLFLVVKQYY